MKTETKFEWNIGDIVRLIDPGASYTTYVKLFMQMGFNNTQRNPCADEWVDMVGEVFDIGHEGGEASHIAIILENGREILMCPSGIEKLSFKRPDPSIIVTLNSEYQAQVCHDNTVVVGCQTFSFDVIKELSAAVTKMQLKK